MRFDRWGTLAATAFGALFLAALPFERAYGVAVPPLCCRVPTRSNAAISLQDFSRLGPGEDAQSYWEGVPRANGSQRRPADLLAEPANTPTVTINVPDNRDVFGSSAGRSFRTSS